MSISFLSEDAAQNSWTPTSSKHEGRPSSALFLAPSKRDTLRTTGRSSPSSSLRREPQDASSPSRSSSNGCGGSPSSSKSGGSSTEEIRASIHRLKNNGVGGVGKSTSTLIRNEETGRFVIRDVDDDHFDDIMKVEMKMPGVIAEEGEENECSSDEEDAGEAEADVAETTRSICGNERRTSKNDTALINPLCSRPQEQSTTHRTLTMSMMTKQIMNESVLDDDAVDAAVRVATECLSITSSTTSKELSAEENIWARQQEVEPHAVRAETKEDDPFAYHIGTDSNDKDDNEDDFFVIRRPQQLQGSGAKWSAFEESNAHPSFDDFDISPNSMDEWGDAGNNSDGDSFDFRPQWNDWDDSGFGECWTNVTEGKEKAEKEKKAKGKKSHFASPSSVLKLRGPATSTRLSEETRL